MLGCPFIKRNKTIWRRPSFRTASICVERYNGQHLFVFRRKMTSNDRMDTVGEEEHDPIRLKSIKTNKTFTVPQNDRVRTLFTRTTKLPNSGDTFHGLIGSFSSTAATVTCHARYSCVYNHFTTPFLHFPQFGSCRSVREFEKLNRIGEGTYGIVCKF